MKEKTADLVEKVRRFTRRKLVRAITSVVTKEPLVALTFDDGPNPDATPNLLRILAAHGAKATFFLVGEHAAAHPELVEAVIKGGHAVGNHSWDHPSFPLVSGNERREQIRRCAAVLGGGNDKFFRPPYGHNSVSSQMDILLTGHHVVGWSIAVPDWEEHDGEWLANFALARISPGSVILLHDGIFDSPGAICTTRKSTLEAVDRILTATRGRYEFVALPEILCRGHPIRTSFQIDADIGFLNTLNRRSGLARRYS